MFIPRGVFKIVNTSTQAFNFYKNIDTNADNKLATAFSFEQRFPILIQQNSATQNSTMMVDINISVE